MYFVHFPDFQLIFLQNIWLGLVHSFHLKSPTSLYLHISTADILFYPIITH